MEDRETARIRKYGESKMTRIMMATVPHVSSGLGLRKFQSDGFLLTRVYVSKELALSGNWPSSFLDLNKFAACGSSTGQELQQRCGAVQRSAVGCACCKSRISRWQ